MKTILRHNERMSAAMVGGKFTNQQVMIRNRINVPIFFVLTKFFYSDLYRQIADSVAGILAKIDFNDHNSILLASASIKDLFFTIEFSRERKKTVFEYYDRYFKPDELVSIRASTVGNISDESEDSVNNAFAGMSETFLYTPREKVIDAIYGCWASGYSSESLIYRHAQGFSLSGFSVAVGIQKMIFGERSFVMFTCNPATSAKDTIIASGLGIGEGVVREVVPIDHYFVSGQDGSIRHEVVCKDKKMSGDFARGHGLKVVTVTGQEAESAALTDEQIRIIVKFGTKIENMFGAPQDIEGTITADNEIHFLQSRPIVFDYGRRIVWSNSNITESFPGISTPLTFSFARYFYEVIFYDVYRLLGVSPSVVMNNSWRLAKMVGYLDGRIYYNLTAFYNLHTQTPLFPLLRAHWEKMIGLGSSYQTHDGIYGSGFAEKIRGVIKIATGCRHIGSQYFRHDRNMTNFYKWWDRLNGDLRNRDLTGMDPLEVVGLFNNVWNEVRDNWGKTLINDSFLPVFNGLAETIFSRPEFSSYPGLLSDLLCGGGKLKSVEIMLSAVSLSEIVRNSKKLTAVFKQKSDIEIWNLIKEKKIDNQFRTAVLKHLAENGDRGLQELKLEQPNLRETPDELISIIRRYADREITVAALRAHEKKVRQQAEIKLRKIMKGRPVTLLYYNYILAKLRNYIRHRENSRYCRSELYGFSKNVFNALAKYFVKEKIIRDRDDIFFLTMEEIFGYVDGTGVTENLLSLVELRRKEFDVNKEKNCAEQITTIGPVRKNFYAPAPDCRKDQNNILKGLPSASGKVYGIARIVLDPLKVKKIHEDEILIARETDPGWLFLMMSSRGIIVEKGSSLSHTAITGRKFNIPTIVALKDVTRIIPDGALISMDGATGIVEIINEYPELPTNGGQVSINPGTGTVG